MLRDIGIHQCRIDRSVHLGLKTMRCRHRNHGANQEYAYTSPFRGQSAQKIVNFRRMIRASAPAAIQGGDEADAGYSRY
jgi:hypothetical protein